MRPIYDVMWKKLEKALSDKSSMKMQNEELELENNKLKTRIEELDHEVEVGQINHRRRKRGISFAISFPQRVMGQRADLLIQLAEMRSYTDEVLTLANMVLSSDHSVCSTL